MVVVAKTDRRGADRLVPRPCENCQTIEGMDGVLRTERCVYFRCCVCGFVHSLMKPGHSAHPPDSEAAKVDQWLSGQFPAKPSDGVVP